jgi:D-arabinose 1-dehydrogenase-like Zn-dependent alcohol dehydrogenase
VEVIPFDKAQYGFERLKKGDIRYRLVLKIDGFREAQ